MKNLIKNSNSFAHNFFSDKTFKKILQPCLLIAMFFFFTNSIKVLAQNINNIRFAEILFSILFILGFLFSLGWFIKNLNRKNKDKVITFIDNEQNIKFFLMGLVFLYGINIYIFM